MNGSPPFEPHHGEAAARALDQHGADFFLGEGVGRFFLAHVEALGVRRGEVEQRVVGQVIVEDGVGLLQDAAAFDGDEFGIAGAGADQVDLHWLGTAGWHEQTARRRASGTGVRRTASAAAFERRRVMCRRPPGWPRAPCRSSAPGALRCIRFRHRAFGLGADHLGAVGRDHDAETRTRPSATVAYAPIGTWQPPPSAPSTPRSAVTAACVAA